MAEPKETFSRPLVISWRFLWAVVTGWATLTLSVVGLAISGAGWKHDTESALAAIKADIVTIRADQAASRQRGDAIRAQLASHDVSIARIATTLENIVTMTAEIRGDVKRLMGSSRFGSLDAPVWTSPGILNRRAQ